MKVYTKIVYDKDDNIIEEHSYNYNGPVSQAKKFHKPTRKSKLVITDATKIKKLIEDAKNGKTSRNKTINDKNLKFYEKQLKIIEEGIVNNYSLHTDEKNLSTGGRISTGGGGGAGGRHSENILHKLASYTTLFTLSGLSEEELQDHSFLRNPVHDVVARSGGIGDPNVSSSPFATVTGHKDKIIKTEQETFKKLFSHSIDVLEKGRDIFFESLNLISTVGPSEERGLADFVKMEFKLHEPYGISFIEKMKAATRLNGYKDHMDAPMLLTIEFKGFNENGIPIQSGGTVRKIPILVTRVEFDVNEGGAIYDVIAVRINDIAFDDRFKFPRTEIDIQASILSNGIMSTEGPSKVPPGAVEQLAMKLNESIKKEIKEGVRTLADEYKIEVDDEVIARSKDYISPNKSTHTANTGGGKTKSKIGNQNLNASLKLEAMETIVTDLVSVTKLIEDLVRSTNGYESIATKFWITYLRKSGVHVRENEKDKTEKQVENFIKSGDFERELEKDPFVDWFKIKTSVETKYNEGLDKITKMHRKIITYKVIPYKVHVLKFIKPGVYMNAKDLRKQVYKRYNYLYTGANHDIQNLRIHYKAAYYQRNTIPVKKLNKGGFSKIISGIVARIKGEEDVVNNDTAMLRSYPSVVEGENVVNAGTDGTAGKEALKQDFYDVLTNPIADMMRIEMEILGDPAYICQDQFTPLDRDGNQHNKSKEKFNNTLGCFNADNHTPLIELFYSLPDDINEKTGLMFESKDTVEENLFFAGIYQVVKIESRIESGQFIQNLICVRLNNQQGEGLNPNFTDAGKFAQTAVNNKSSDKKEKPSKLEEKWKKADAEYEKYAITYGLKKE